MEIDRALVEKLAELSRLALTPEEVERMRVQLHGILEKFEEIKALDVAGVEPTTQAVPVASVTRPDVPAPSLPREQALANAPAAYEGCFRVPRVI